MLVVSRERNAGGRLLAGGLAYRFFLWLVLSGLVLAAALGFWVADAAGLDDAAWEFGLTAGTQAIMSSSLVRRAVVLKAVAHRSTRRRTSAVR